ncbi:MAG TPA: ATP-binding protein [Polyangia bacterium]
MPVAADTKSRARVGLDRIARTFKTERADPAERRPPRRRRGLRVRLSLFLIVATLVPVIAVAAVAAALVFSSVEQGIEFEAQRGLQVARALLLGEVRERATAAAALGNEGALLDALARTPMDVRRRLAELSERQPSALLEVTDAVGRVLARCAAGTCNDAIVSERFAAFDSADRSPVVRRALEFERTISIESAGNWLVVRAAFPLVDPALRLLGSAVVSASINGPVADHVKAELGAAREVIFYRGTEPSTSTFTSPTGARFPGPALPSVAIGAGRDARVPVVALDFGGKSYSVAFGPIQDPGGRRVGFLGVALDRETLAAARRRVTITLVLGAVSVLLIAIGLADVLARRLTRPLQDLHAGAMSIALGNLDTKIGVDSPDELGDVAEAFRVMLQSLKENQEGLAARVRELVTVHQIGRTISSMVELDQLLRAVTNEALTVLSAQTVAIALAAEGASAQARKFTVRAVAGEPVGRRLADMAKVVAERSRAIRTAAVESDPDLGAAAAGAGMKGPLIAAPLGLKDRTVGVILVGRPGAEAFSESDLRLLVTLADQTATAIENARLYSEVRTFSEDLEMKVRARTAELERAKAETERALGELRTAQTQLAHSERMAGLGQLVAGIAHEVNSPAAAVQGSVDALEQTIRRVEAGAREIFQLGLPASSLDRYLALVARVMAAPGDRVMPSAVETRQLGRRLRVVLGDSADAEDAAAALAELGTVAESVAEDLRQIAGRRPLAPLAGYLRELAFLNRASSTVRTAIQSIRRIVGALKRYSRLDEAPLENVDIHAGIEDTLVILSHQLKSRDNGINLKRSYGNLPLIAAYVGELNQVWTNLIHNAIQALGSSGEILIETAVHGTEIRVAIQDDGPGIPPNVLPRIFDPFFTTKGKGEGTGLGLSIAHNIVEKHGGRITVESAPGRTRFEVALPVVRPEGVPAPRPFADLSTGQVRGPATQDVAQGVVSMVTEVTRPLAPPRVKAAPPPRAGRTRTGGSEGQD